jgi:hypothetical protein
MTNLSFGTGLPNSGQSGVMMLIRPQIPRCSTNATSLQGRG